jgi:hypothetical protein
MGHRFEAPTSFSTRVAAFDAGAATREEVEALYTDGCAELLALEAERIRADKDLRAALGEAAGPNGRVRRLSDGLEAVTEELGRLRAQVHALRATLDGVSHSA